MKVACGCRKGQSGGGPYVYVCEYHMKHGRDTVSLTKQDIDALVDGMPRGTKTVVGIGGVCAGACEGVFIQGVGPDELVSRAGMRRTLYLAAGLTAEGERKPERVRCWMVQRDKILPPGVGYSVFPMIVMDKPRSKDWEVTSGWFVPDGAE